MVGREASGIKEMSVGEFVTHGGLTFSFVLKHSQNFPESSGKGVISSSGSAGTGFGTLVGGAGFLTFLWPAPASSAFKQIVLMVLPMPGL